MSGQKQTRISAIRFGAVAVAAAGLALTAAGCGEKSASGTAVTQASSQPSGASPATGQPTPTQPSATQPSAAQATSTTGASSAASASASAENSAKATVTVPAPTPPPSKVAPTSINLPPPNSSATDPSATSAPTDVPSDPATGTPPTNQAPGLAGSALMSGAWFSPTAFSVPSRGGVRLSTLPSGSLHGKVIVIDPGHNGRYSSSIDGKSTYAGFGEYKACNSSGTASNSGYTEHAFTWSVATKLATLLRNSGATVWLTRPNDSGYGPCIDKRAAVGNATHAAFVMSIHADGNTSTSNHGFHVIYSTHMTGGAAVQAASARDATLIRNSFQTVMARSNYIGGGSALSPRSDLGGLNLSNVPEAMVECGNMFTSTDMSKLGSATWQQSAARALYNGIVASVR